MTRLFGFSGGLANLVPTTGVASATSLPIQPAIIPSRLYFPLTGFSGKPLVSAGDRVAVGQRLTESAQDREVAWHAPVSGTIAELVEHPAPHAAGITVPTLVLLPDQCGVEVESHPEGWESLSLQKLVELVRDGGVSGMGGAGFPTWKKIAQGLRKRFTTLIVNGVECEPYISCDDMLMRTEAEVLVDATERLASLLEVNRVLFALEEDCPEALAALKGECSAGSPLELVSLPTRYPSGSEKQLIENLLGLQVPRGGYPADLGVLCINVATLHAINAVVSVGQPLTRRVVTVEGDGIAQPQNRWVLLGTPVSDLLQSCGGQVSDGCELVVGGPMMGYALASPSAPIVKTTNCILVRQAQRMPSLESEQPCIRCGVCVTACPANLLPQQLYWYAKSNQTEQLQRHHLFDCIECGVCAYVCPSNIPLVHYYRAAKDEIRQQLVAKQKADIARQRMIDREARLERRQQEAVERRKRKRAERGSAASPEQSATSPEVAAAIARATALNQQKQSNENRNDESGGET